MTTTLIAIALLAAYTVTLCVVNKEIPSSLSASVFYLPKTGQWLWTAVIVAVVFLVAPTLISKTSESTQFLAFIACAGLLFVGGAPLVKDKSDMAYHVHMGGAIACAVASQILLAFNAPWLLLLWAFWIGDAIYTRAHHNQWRTAVFWAEMTCFCDIFIFCII